ncbi:MAG: hypothetical protein QM644_16890 [Mobilitalea sp.]
MDKKKEFINYLEKSSEEALHQEKKLILDERKDEANLVKIKNNIYNIFKITFVSIIKNEKSGEVEIKSLFIEKLESIPKNWIASYEIAKLHNDAEKILIEEIKLQTLALIKTKFNEIWGDIA